MPTTRTTEDAPTEDAPTDVRPRVIWDAVRGTRDPNTSKRWIAIGVPLGAAALAAGLLTGSAGDQQGLAPAAAAAEPGLAADAPPGAPTADQPVTPGTQTPTPTGLVVPAACPNPAGWSNEQLAQLLVVPGFDASAGWPNWLGAGVGGVFLPDGSGGLNAGAFRPGSPAFPTSPQPYVAVDYEGGPVSDHAGLIGTMPSPREQAATMSPEQVRSLAADRAGAMQYYGINVDYAPMADLDLGSPIVGARSYGSDPATVVTYAGAFADGLRDNGVLPVLKHFPGHGSADGDSHIQLATTDPWNVLQARDVPVYTELLAQPGPWMVMMGHLVVPGLSFDSETPTSVDPAAYAALREITGFQGPVITDDLSGMKAITDRLTVPQAVVSAISAGADMALVSGAAHYWGSVAALTEWAGNDQGKRQQLIDSAVRSLTALPCGRP
ncbi:MAG: glycoside hydrolase family 3 protein [Actinobacteria bacterium]|nr:glycoside hydrolase family 3 protein [Actinomycetota bacterium]